MQCNNCGEKCHMIHMTRCWRCDSDLSQQPERRAEEDSRSSSGYGKGLPRIRNADGSLKHIICEGSREHVISYSSNGQHRSEPECEMNRQPSHTEKLRRCEQEPNRRKQKGLTKMDEKETQNSGSQSACSGWLDALERFLENHGSSYLSWQDGCVVIETYYEKQFRALGGDPLRMPAYFEDYGNMHDASRHYIADLRSASNGGSELRPPGKRL